MSGAARGANAARHVIGIAGPVGAGKTTLLRQLANRLAESTPIHFDDYESLTSQPIEKIKKWMQCGGDMRAVQVAGLAADLLSLKAGQAVSNGVTMTPGPTGKYILFETQFGRRHAETGRHIDYLVWIDTPLDIALARKLRQFTRELGEAKPAEAHEEFCGWLGGYLDNYLEVVGELLRIQRDSVAADADLIIDGSAEREFLAGLVEGEIRKRFE